MKSILPRSSKNQASDWPSRTRSHRANIADLLVQRAKQGLGVRGSELYASPEEFGRSPRNRISELRRDGWNIGGKAHDSSDWFYWLRSDNAGRSYATARFDEPANPRRPQFVAQPQLKEPEWKDRPRVTGLPLFDMVTR